MMIKLKNFSKKQILLMAVAIFGLVIMVAVLLYVFYPSFKEDVDNLYYSTYYNFVIDPGLTSVANKKANLLYCDKSDRMQKMDVYTPKNLDKAAPVVMYIHGGGWIGGDKSNPFVADYGAEIVKHNMAFISVNYRLAPQFTYPAQNEDIDCAISYLNANTKTLKIDMARVALMGDSAGGQLASMVALTSQYKKQIKAVVDFYGPADVWAQVTRKPTPDKWAINYLGTANNEPLARRASPMFASLAGAPPFLIFHGINDRTVYYAQSVNFEAKLKAAGVDATLVGVKNAGHYFTDQSQPSISAVEAQMITFLNKNLAN